MSVILKALRTQKKEEQIKEGLNGEGVEQPEIASVFGQQNSGSLGRFFGVKVFRMVGLILGSVIALGLLSYTLYWLVTKFFLKDQEAEQQLQNQVVIQKTPEQEAIELVRLANKSFYDLNYTESLEQFKKALEFDSKNMTIHNGMGLIYLRRKLYDNAEDHFKEALKLDENCAACYNNFGYLKTVTKDNMEALAYLKKAIQIDNNYADAHFNLAVLYENMGKLEEAVSAYSIFLDKQADKDSPIYRRVKEHVETLTGQPH